MYLAINYCYGHQEKAIVDIDVDIGHSVYDDSEAIRYGVEPGRKYWYASFDFGLLQIGKRYLLDVSISPFDHYRVHLMILWIRIR